MPFSLLFLYPGSLLHQKMAALIFVDQENGELHAPKSQLKLHSGSSRVLAERKVNTPLPKKAIPTSPVTFRSARKVLGNVNKTEGVMSKMDKIEQKNQLCPVNKPGLEICHTVAEEDWPEIENMFPWDFQDFEDYDVPEEYKLSNINLCGVPLMIFDTPCDKPFDTPYDDSYVDMDPSPVMTEKFSWESKLRSTADYVVPVYEIEMPPPLEFYDD